MEFKSLKNIETGFRQIRFFGIAYLFVCASLVGFSFGRHTALPRHNDRRYMSLTRASR